MDSNQRSAFSRGHEFLKTLQVPLQTFKMGLDLASPFTAIEPTTSVVVGVLRAVTAMAITLAGTKPDLAESVAAMLEQMSYIDDCNTLGQKANRLDIHQALAAVYKSLLEFYKVAYEMLTRKGMALTIAVLSNSGPLPDAIQTFLRHATTLHKIVSKATLEIVQDIKRLLCDQEIDRWLASDQLRCQTQYHAELGEHRANEACMDLLADERFTSWYEDAEPSQLAIFGEMGSGKTMTMAFIVDELCRRSRSQIPQSKVCYYYCRNDETGRTLQILSALTLALLEQLPGLKKTFYDWYKKHQASNNIDPGTDASKLTEFLTGIVGTLERPLYFVIDGLEECDRQSQYGVLELLRALQRSTPTVKSVVSSRPQQEMLAQIGAKYQVHLTPNARRDEIITRYMVTTGLPDLSEDVQTYLMDRLSRMACGSAIWLKMMVDLIACHRISQIGPMKRFFDGGSLPTTLTQLYDTLLSRYALDDAENLNLAKTALKMLAVASRPLSISELAWAVATAEAFSDLFFFFSFLENRR